MSIDLTPTDRTDRHGQPGPAYAPPQAPQVPPPAEPRQPYAQQPDVQQQAAAPQAPAAYGARPEEVVEHHYGPEGLVATPTVVLPPERVGHGALLALLAVPVGAVLSAIIWRLGFVASLSGVVVAAGAAVLYARGSGGRVRKGIPVVAGIIALGIVASFFAAVATDLWTVFPTLDEEITGSYPSRGAFVRENLTYGPVLAEYTRDVVLFVLFGVLGGFGTILRLVRTNASLQR